LDAADEGVVTSGLDARMTVRGDIDGLDCEYEELPPSCVGRDVAVVGVRSVESPAAAAVILLVGGAIAPGRRMSSSSAGGVDGDVVA
jgi:hypothetical protein